MPLLDFEGRIVGRQRELDELHDAVQRAERAGGHCVLLHGVPGVGKSTLLEAFGNELARRGAVFAYGRCRDGASAPYTGVGEALSQLVGAMAVLDPAERDQWRDELSRDNVPVSAVLGDLVPELAAELGAEPIADPLDAAEARRRLHRAVVKLVSASASYLTLVVAVDDLQWADPDSLLLLSELLSVAPRNVLLLAAHRTGESDWSPADVMSSTVRTLHLEPLSGTDIENLLAAAVGPDSELAEVAKEFAHRTGGNPLHIRQLLHRAQRDGALTPRDGDGHLRWDLHALSSIEVSPTEGEFLGRYLDQLRPPDRQLLAALACIGGEFDLADATAATALPADTVAQSVWTFLELRLLDAVDGGGRRIDNTISYKARYRFTHDRVAEAARETLSADAQRQVHLALSRRLADLGEPRLFEAARHAGIGAASLTDDAERVRFAELLRRAAARARSQASLPLTLQYCRDALGLLGPHRWTDHFSLTRELLLDAAEAALLICDFAALHAMLDEAGSHLTEPGDRARLAYLRIRGGFAEDRLQEAMDIGLAALRELGDPLPAAAGKPRMLNALLQMRLTMSRWSTERLLELPPCEDPFVVEKLRILAELCNEAYNIRPNLLPLFVRKQLELTLAHGHTPSSPRVFATYGLLLIIIGDRGGAQRFGEIGMTLAERDYPEATPQTAFLHLGFIRHWRHPLRHGLTTLHKAVADALDRGDQEYAGFLTATLISQSFWMGRPLSEIDTLAQSLIPAIRSQPVPHRFCQAMQQMALNLMGRSEDPYLLAGESGYDEREVIPAAQRSGEEVVLSIAATMKQGLHFWSGDHAGAVAATREAVERVGGLAGTAVAPLVYMIGALSMMQHAPNDRATANFVRATLAMHRKYAEGAPENYGAAYALLEGAWARVRGRNGKAERHLHRAIALAEENQLPMIGARAQEEAATLYRDTGRVTLHDHLLRLAYQRWVSLGVVIRTDWLVREHPWLLSHDLVDQGDARLDPVGAHRLARALAGADTADSLAGIVLHSVAETTGATRVLLFVGQSTDLTVRAGYRDGAISVDGQDRHDDGIVRRVAAGGSSWLDGSVLAVPIMLQDRAIGVIYAEHPRGTTRFTGGHEEALTFVAAQAAAPLWAFELEAQLRAADEYRQSLLEVQSRFVPTELLRILDLDDLRRVRAGHRVEREMTVLISDIRGYTTLLEDMDVAEASNLAMGFLRAVELPIISCHGLLQDIRGDEIVAIFDSATDAVQAGLSMLRSLAEHNRERAALGSAELRAGIGVNTGTVGVGLVGGVNRMALTVIGDAVNLAARIESTNKRYGSALLISEATRDHLDSSRPFDIRRMERVLVVNRRRPVTIYEVYDGDSESLRTAKRAAQPVFDRAFAAFDTGDVDGARREFEHCLQLLPDDPVAPLHLAHCEAISRGDMIAGQDVVLHQK